MTLPSSIAAIDEGSSCGTETSPALSTFARTDLSGSAAIVSDVLDCAKWIECLPNKAEPLSNRDIRASGMPVPKDSLLPFSEKSAYSLGWFQGSCGGSTVYMHDGSSIGFRARVYWLPERKNANITPSALKQIKKVEPPSPGEGVCPNRPKTPSPSSFRHERSRPAPTSAESTQKLEFREDPHRTEPGARVLVADTWRERWELGRASGDERIVARGERKTSRTSGPGKSRGRKERPSFWAGRVVEQQRNAGRDRWVHVQQARMNL